MFNYIHRDFKYLFKKMRREGFRSNRVIIPLILFTRDYWIPLKVLDMMIIIGSIFIFFILLPLMRQGKIKGYYPTDYLFIGDQLQTFFFLLNSAILRVLINYSVMFFNYALIDSVTEANKQSRAIRALLEPLRAYSLILLSLIGLGVLIYFLFYHKKEILVSNYGRMPVDEGVNIKKAVNSNIVRSNKSKIKVSNNEQTDDESEESNQVYRRYPKRD